jgi:lysine/ornithine N-monooxygenase
MNKWDSSMPDHFFDVIGIGFEPANIALAASFEKRNPACPFSQEKAWPTDLQRPNIY